MAKYNGLTIDTNGISDAEKSTPLFQSALNDMLAQLSTPGFIPALCAHEAGHLIYFTAAGTKNYEALPAQLRFDPRKGDYVGHLAAIQVKDLPPWTPGRFDEWLFRVACGHAAGGVVARKLLPSSDGGDSDDKARFQQLCNEFNKRTPDLHLDWQHCWKLAQDSITKDLENPQLVDAIKTAAADLRGKFGL